MCDARRIAPCLLLLCAATAQERKPAFGRVVDAAGAPVPGAEVRLFSSTVGELGAAATDSVAATTARAPCRPGALSRQWSECSHERSRRLSRSSLAGPGSDRMAVLRRCDWQPYESAAHGNRRRED